MFDRRSAQFPICVRLRCGKDPRKIRIALFSRLEEPDRIAPLRVLDAFVGAADCGLLGSARLLDPQHSVKVLAEHGVVTDVLTGTLLRASPTDLLVLPHMARASVPGISGLEILEEHRDERTLVVRTLGPDVEATIQELDFQIGFEQVASPSIRIGFQAPPETPAIGQTTRALKAWAELLALGAFPPADGSPPAGRLLELTARDRLEISARFDRLGCGYAAFESLFAALDLVHERAPLTKVTIGWGKAAALSPTTHPG